ncbi:hypothetical protein IQ265_17620 [Nodosilinea sp. LEGE 06152]|uniref:hypothetical protein n=1 Tax=Nodosilinea sp. LEGE 06152 TaxID=2777966 RepID=UPI00188001D8|nr:hypothetical protein [Nodosilinea sp. LEGE 06152]MBE9158636.1 hypothetical protein [Nodosilinea sp. LEGE 06152]
MTQFSHTADIEAVHQLLTSYSFEAEPYPTKAIVANWLAEFGPVWVSHAITEALYQGRYKLISIDQILKLWQRRGQPIRHFNREFESIILGQTLLYPTGYGDGPEPSTLRRAVAPVAVETAPQSASPSPAPELFTLPSEQTDPEHIAADQTASPSQDIAAAAQDMPSASDEPGALKGVEESAAVEESAGDEEPSSTNEPAVVHAAHGSSSAIADEPDCTVPDFRPIAPDGPSRWQQIEVIQTFVPRRDESELHERLRAVVQGGMRE